MNKLVRIILERKRVIVTYTYFCSEKLARRIFVFDKLTNAGLSFFVLVTNRSSFGNWRWSLDAFSISQPFFPRKCINERNVSFKSYVSHASFKSACKCYVRHQPSDHTNLFSIIIERSRVQLVAASFIRHRKDFERKEQKILSSSLTTIFFFFFTVKLSPSTSHRVRQSLRGTFNPAGKIHKGLGGVNEGSKCRVFGVWLRATNESNFVF